MDASAERYFKVFGVEEGCGGEAQLLGAVRALAAVERAVWHAPSHGMCVHLLDPSATGTVTQAVRGLGYQVSTVQANCPCCTTDVPVRDPLPAYYFVGASVRSVPGFVHLRC